MVEIYRIHGKLVNFYYTTHDNISADANLHSHHRVNFNLASLSTYSLYQPTLAELENLLMKEKISLNLGLTKIVI
jgi:hypothetical protein